jgi:hypothetical protein
MHSNPFGVCSFFHLSLYLADGDVLLKEVVTMKSEKEVEDHDVLDPLRHFGKTNKRNRLKLILTSISLHPFSRDETATLAIDFRGSTCQMFKMPVTIYLVSLTY